MARFEFPPPASASGDGWEKVDYPTGDGSGGFIFPPPRGGGSGDLAESTWELGEAVGQWRDQVTSTADEVHNLGVVVADYGNALERKVEPWAVPTVAPLSQSINRRADATFQLQGFMGLDLPLAGNTRGESGHYHALTGDHVNPGRVDRALAEGWTVGNRTYVAFITPAINRAYEQVNFMVAAVNGTPSNMDVAIYVTDENKILTSQIGVQRVEGVGLGDELVSVTFPTWVATQGSYIAVAVRQHAAGTQRALLGLHDTPRPLSNVVFPRKITAYRHTSTAALPATMDGETELDFEADWFVPYIELSEAVGVDYRNFTESWPDVSEIGRPWVPLTSRGINSGGGYTSAGGVGTRVSMYDTPLSTDHTRVRTSIHQVFASSEPSTLIVRGTNDLRSGLGLQAIPHHDGHSVGRFELITWSNQSPSRNWLHDKTVIRTIDIRPSDRQTIEVDYIDGLVTVRINANPYLTDQPVAGHSGAARRFVGIQNERTSSGGLFPTYFPSPWFGPWSARDLPMGDGGSEGEDDDGEGEGEP